MKQERLNQIKKWIAARNNPSLKVTMEAMAELVAEVERLQAKSATVSRRKAPSPDA